MKRKEL